MFTQLNDQIHQIFPRTLNNSVLLHSLKFNINYFFFVCLPCFVFFFQIATRLARVHNKHIGIGAVYSKQTQEMLCSLDI